MREKQNRECLSGTKRKREAITILSPAEKSRFNPVHNLGKKRKRFEVDVLQETHPFPKLPCLAKKCQKSYSPVHKVGEKRKRVEERDELVLSSPCVKQPRWRAVCLPSKGGFSVLEKVQSFKDSKISKSLLSESKSIPALEALDAAMVFLAFPETDAGRGRSSVAPSCSPPMSMPRCPDGWWVFGMQIALFPPPKPPPDGSPCWVTCAGGQQSIPDRIETISVLLGAEGSRRDWISDCYTTRLLQPITGRWLGTASGYQLSAAVLEGSIQQLVLGANGFRWTVLAEVVATWQKIYGFIIIIKKNNLHAKRSVEYALWKIGPPLEIDFIKKQGKVTTNERKNIFILDGDREEEEKLAQPSKRRKTEKIEAGWEEGEGGNKREIKEEVSMRNEEWGRLPTADAKKTAMANVKSPKKKKMRMVTKMKNTTARALSMDRPGLKNDQMVPLLYHSS